MAPFIHASQRFSFKGINLRAPIDAMPAGQFPFLQNIRGYRETEVVSRPGLTRVNTNALTEAIVHSMARLSDTTPWASQPFTRIVGAGTKLFSGPAAAFAEIATGFSGDPLGLTAIAPNEVPEAWMYVADRAKMVKVRSDNAVRNIGLPPPGVAPTAALQAPTTTLISDFSTAVGWNAIGCSGAASASNRVNTTISTILYDTGATGWASVSLGTLDNNVQAGIFLTFNGSETALVQDVRPAVSATTVGSIKYDAGTTGLCTIQPVGWALAGSAFRKTVGINPATGERVVVQEIETGVDCLITVGGESVRVLSVTMGPDGTQSIRCATTGTRGAGDAIVGVRSIRVFLAGTFAATNTVVTVMVNSTLTPTAAQLTGGLRATLAVNMGLIGTRPTQPDDEIHLSIRVDDLSLMAEGRVYFDVDATTNDFTRNYYFYAFRPSDLINAIQTVNADDVQTVAAARTTIVSQQQLDIQPGDSGGRGGTGPLLEGVPNQPAVGVDNSQAATADSISSQMGLGSSQWAELRFKVADLQRVGSDSSRTLVNVAAVEITIAANAAGSLAVNYDALWIGGAYGPDVGTIGAPYVYAAVARSSETGAVSNPSPATRSGVSPRRQGVTLTIPQQTDAQCDLIDWYRLGGVLTKWRYVGTCNNTGSPTFSDVYSDLAIDGNPEIVFDNFQPWPTIDEPKSGTVNVAGTKVTSTGGDSFNVAWAPGNVIEINGIVQQLYGSPSSATSLEIEANAGTLTAVSWIIQAPTVMATPLPCWWGDQQGVYFACGDDKNPGRLYWAKQFQPETASDQAYLDVTDPDEPLQNGCIFDGRSFVWSTTDLYEIIPSGNPTQPYVARKTVCNFGLWSRWAFCVNGQLNMAFVHPEGIRMTAGGESKSLTDGDLYPIFPHDGQPGVAVNGIQPPDMSQPTKLRLTAINTYIYFDYLDLDGNAQSLVYDLTRDGWILDTYHQTVVSHFSDEGPDAADILVGDTSGRLFQMIGDLDDASPVNSLVQTPSHTGGDIRVDKLLGDFFLEADARGGAGFTITPGINQFQTTLPTQVKAASTTGRQAIVIDTPLDTYGRDFGLRIAWSSDTGVQPILFAWQPWFIEKAEQTDLRPTDWEDGAETGAKFVQGIEINADTFGQDKTLQVQGDAGQVIATIVVNHHGEEAKDYSFPTPIIAHMMRLVPLDTQPWRHYTSLWRFQSAPESATTWQTQPTTHDLQGWLHLRPFAYLAYEATAPVVFTVQTDSQTFTYSLPSTAGAFVKAIVYLKVMKAKKFSYRVSSTAGVRLYAKDVEVGVRPWGSGAPYQIVRPFGGNSRDHGSGANI